MLSRRHLLVAMLALPMLGCAPADERDWLNGRWESIPKPGGPPKDWMEFVDGQAISISPTGFRVGGPYVLSGDTIKVIFDADGTPIPFTFTVSADKALLVARADNTGDTSEYRKVRTAKSGKR